MQCRRCCEVIREINDDGRQVFVHNDEGYESLACPAATETSGFPWHIPMTGEFLVAETDRYYLHVGCQNCGITEEFQYTKNLGQRGPLPDKHLAEELRDVWMWKHATEECEYREQ